MLMMVELLWRCNLILEYTCWRLTHIFRHWGRILPQCLNKPEKKSKMYCIFMLNVVLCIRFACVAQLVAQLIRNQ